MKKFILSLICLLVLFPIRVLAEENENQEDVAFIYSWNNDVALDKNGNILTNTIAFNSRCKNDPCFVVLDENGKVIEERYSPYETISEGVMSAVNFYGILPDYLNNQTIRVWITKTGVSDKTVYHTFYLTPENGYIQKSFVSSAEYIVNARIENDEFKNIEPFVVSPIQINENSINEIVVDFTKEADNSTSEIEGVATDGHQETIIETTNEKSNWSDNSWVSSVIFWVLFVPFSLFLGFISVVMFFKNFRF